VLITRLLTTNNQGGIMATKKNKNAVSPSERTQRKQTRPPVTHLVMCLDESGSMSSYQSAVIKGFNQFLQDQQALKDPARLTLIKFNSRVTFVHKDVSVLKVNKLTSRTYWPSNDTALWEATMKAIAEIDAVIEPEDRAIIMVMTDGCDSGYQYSAYDVKRAIQEREAEDNWTFVFLGLGTEDVFLSVAISAGFPANNILTVTDMVKLMSDVSDAVSVMRINPEAEHDNFFNMNENEQKVRKAQVQRYKY
jgi:Mg-chelatase subunit ChlD